MPSEPTHANTLHAPVASDSHDARRRLESDGFAILPERVEPEVVRRLTERVERAVEATAGEARRGKGNLRNLLDHVPDLPALLRAGGVAACVERLTGRGAFITRGLLFDKVAGANWPMRYHQDLTIAVAERRPGALGFGPWSVKAGVPHVEPPVPVLERMLALRIHLDRCGENNGPLRVVPGSHRLGRLDPANIPETRERLGEQACLVPAGGVMLMRPLLLHASSPAESPRHRRVIHLELATDDLPMGLRWSERVALTDG